VDKVKRILCGAPSSILIGSPISRLRLPRAAASALLGRCDLAPAFAALLSWQEDIG
jgi:hypothetical protein